MYTHTHTHTNTHTQTHTHTNTQVNVAHMILWPVLAAAFRLVELIFAVQFSHWGEWRPTMDFVKDFYGFANIHSPGAKHIRNTSGTH
jgi:hypothetical protein